MPLTVPNVVKFSICLCYSVFAATCVIKHQNISSHKSQILQCGHGLVKGTVTLP